MTTQLYLPPPKSADEKVKEIFLDLRYRDFTGMDTFSSLGWLEAQYVPGQMTMTIDNINYDTGKSSQSVLEFILDANYDLADVAQTVKGHQIFWTENQRKKEEWLIAECLMHDPRHVLYYRGNVREINSSTYSFNIGGPLKKLTEAAGVSLRAEITVWGDALQELVLYSEGDLGETLIGKTFFYYP